MSDKSCGYLACQLILIFYIIYAALVTLVLIGMIVLIDNEVSGGGHHGQLDKAMIIARLTAMKHNIIFVLILLEIILAIGLVGAIREQRITLCFFATVSAILVVLGLILALKLLLLGSSGTTPETHSSRHKVGAIILGSTVWLLLIALFSCTLGCMEKS